MIAILWDLDGTIQDSESLAKEGTRHGFQQILGREPTIDEFAQLVVRPVPVVYGEWFDDSVGGRLPDLCELTILDSSLRQAAAIPATLERSEGNNTAAAQTANTVRAWNHLLFGGRIQLSDVPRDDGVLRVGYAPLSYYMNI